MATLTLTYITGVQVVEFFKSPEAAQARLDEIRRSIDWDLITEAACE